MLLLPHPPDSLPCLPACPAVSVPRSYRAMYILNWIYRYMTETHYKQYIGEKGERLCLLVNVCWM
jgi:hypothetical protein